MQINQAVDVANWDRSDEFATYPEGTRDKTLLYSPHIPDFSFLKGNHNYLFKRSSYRYPEQFWVEVFAYRLGIKMGIVVPPAFVAFDSKKNQSGALIEWFLLENENHILGGDYFKKYIRDFDQKKGTQHNFQTIIQIFKAIFKNNIDSDWGVFWARALVFDALIGNTDRHQDNWGIIENRVNGNVRISPAFDNGTSMGHEISQSKFHLFESNDYIERYVLKGKHHIKWSLSDIVSGHSELLKKLVHEYPEMYLVMMDCLKKTNAQIFKDILNDLTAIEVPTKLTVERADFMLRLLEFRHRYLLNELEK